MPYDLSIPLLSRRNSGTQAPGNVYENGHSILFVIAKKQTNKQKSIYNVTPFSQEAKIHNK